MYHDHQTHRFLQGLVEFEMTEPIQRGRSLPNRHSMHYHDHAEKMRQMHQLQEMKRAHKEPRET